jgi:D-apionolactonase
MTEVKTRFFTAIYQKGAMRRIMHHDTEVVRMIYSAVRDRNWGTVEPDIISENISEDEDGFLIEVKAVYRQEPVHFEAKYTIEARQNRLEFKMEGISKSTYLSNRTGFCVLHPIEECAGKDCLVTHFDGTTRIAPFPVLISPTQPMKDIAEMEWQPAGDVRAKLKFSGDIFEMEDQRNWTDASYKTYCRPLELPFPYEIKAGDKILQKVEFEITAGKINDEQERYEIMFQFDENRKSRLPEIGLSCTSREQPLTLGEAQVLRQFPFSHLRAEFKLFQPGWEAQWERVADESHLLQVPMFAVFYFSENAMAEVAKLKRSLSNRHVHVKYILVVGKNHLPDDAIFEMIFDELKSLFPQAKAGQGVNAYFAELSRNPPKFEKSEFISFGICPQVHATDDSTLVENLEAQRYAVETARELFPAKPVFVSPVTLKQRFNVVATSEEADAQQDVLPPQVDVRQPLVFTAQWLLGSIKFLSQSGTSLITCFETVGWRGFIQGNFEPPVRGKFPAINGDIFPVFHLLQELKNFDEVLFSKSNNPLKVDGLALRNAHTGEIKILLTNYGSEMQNTTITGRMVRGNCSGIFQQVSCNMEDNQVMIPPGEVVIFHLNNEIQ